MVSAVLPDMDVPWAVLQDAAEDTPENYANGKLEPTDIASLE
jgi:hypothetical protein